MAGCAGSGGVSSGDGDMVNIHHRMAELRKRLLFTAALLHLPSIQEDTEHWLVGRFKEIKAELRALKKRFGNVEGGEALKG